MSFLESRENDIIRQFGDPDHLTTSQKMTPAELNIVESSMKNGRAHDITLYISYNDGYIFIAKHPYPPGLFRAPSGGINPGENFVDGAKREALEETGVEIELEKYLLRIDVRFYSEEKTIDWTSRIFTARHVKGDINPRDHREIKEAKLIKKCQFPEMISRMKNSGSGGLIYRAFLTEETAKRLNKPAE